MLLLLLFFLSFIFPCLSIRWFNEYIYDEQINGIFSNNWTVIRLVIQKHTDTFHLHLGFLLYKRKPIELRLSPRVVCCKWDEYLLALWLWLWSILKHIATLSLLMNKMKRRKEGGKHGKKCDNRMAHLPYNPRAQLNLCVVIFCYLQVYLKCVCVCAPTKYIEHTMGLVTF